MNENPNNMSNQDLEDDMKERNKHMPAGNENKDNSNTSEDAEVKPMENKSMDMGVDFEPEKEQDLDALVHEQAKVNHPGTMPDPEELSFREGQ